MKSDFFKVIDDFIHIMEKHSIVKFGTTKEHLCYFPNGFSSMLGVYEFYKSFDDNVLKLYEIGARKILNIRDPELYMLDCLASCPNVSQESARKHWSRMQVLRDNVRKSHGNV